MFELYRQPLVKISIIAAIICSALYVKYVFFDFILSLIYFLKINVPSIAYTVLRITAILCPLILVTPFSREINRVLKFRVMYFIMGICYLLGNTWVIYFLIKNPFSALFDINQLILVQRSDALVLNYLVWNCITVWSLLFSTVQGILYLILSKKIAGHRKEVLILNGIIIAISIFLPIVYSLFDPTLSYIDWIRKDIFVLLSQLFVFLALILAATDRIDWGNFLWEN